MPRSHFKPPPENPSADELLVDMANPSVRKVLVASLIGAIMVMIVIATFTIR